jgi:alpha-ketoglutarate-dependent 2,4-dichlorophenoxyacetate dioxygenase
MGAKVSAVRPDFVGEISGIDLCEELSQEEFAVVRSAVAEYGVVIVRDQHINDEQQARFTRLFGALELPGAASNITQNSDRRLGAEIADLSNLDKDGNLLVGDARQRMFNLGNRLWHSDSSFKPIPAQYSLLSARTVPAVGGDTQFADMSAAYDALSSAQHAELETLVCLHSLIFSRGLLGFDELSASELANFKPVKQSLIRAHPLTGRKSLYLSAHAGEIVGWPTPEARVLLMELNEGATHEQFVYAHHWRQHDLVIWDNQRTMHRARPFADKSLVRDMHRTTVAGLAPTVEQ